MRGSPEMVLKVKRGPRLYACLACLLVFCCIRTIVTGFGVDWVGMYADTIRYISFHVVAIPLLFKIKIHNLIAEHSVDIHLHRSRTREIQIALVQ